jgi:hypothetical protein
MSTVTYIGDEPREVAILPAGFMKVMQPDEKFDVPDEFDASYACQPGFFEVSGMTAEEAIVKGSEAGVPPDEEVQPVEKPAAKKAATKTTSTTTEGK